MCFVQREQVLNQVKSKKLSIVEGLTTFSSIFIAAG